MTAPRTYILGALLAGALGFAAVAWVLLGGVGHHPLALAMTLGIGAVYAVGVAELWRFHRDTRALAHAVAHLKADTAVPAWLDGLPATLRQPVRRRIAGAAAPLPGPALTPYLVGLLVLLGMLGTFLGLVVTLDGTVARPFAAARRARRSSRSQDSRRSASASCRPNAHRSRIRKREKYL